MRQPVNKGICQCGTPARMAGDSTAPIQFDERMNEYHLTNQDGQLWLMRFCYWCGGSLPESKRGSFFTTPDEADMTEIRQLLASATSPADVFEILGPPDETLDLGGAASGPETPVRWERTFRYSSRWKTLVLDVHDIPDGRLRYSMCGHYIGDPEDTE